MDKSNWVWMPHAGHLIVGHSCRFHVATYVGKYIVSTVGEYWPERVSREIHAQVYDPHWLEENQNRLGDDFDHAYMQKFGYEDIGANTKYETMVFEAAPDENDCCPWVMATPRNLDSDRYNDPEEAMRGHLRLCEEWAAKAKEETADEATTPKN